MTNTGNALLCIPLFVNLLNGALSFNANHPEVGFARMHTLAVAELSASSGNKEKLKIFETLRWENTNFFQDEIKGPPLLSLWNEPWCPSEPLLPEDPPSGDLSSPSTFPAATQLVSTTRLNLATEDFSTKGKHFIGLMNKV